MAACTLSRPDFKLFNEFQQEAETLPEIVTKRQKIDQGLVGAN